MDVQKLIELLSLYPKHLEVKAEDFNLFQHEITDVALAHDENVKREKRHIVVLRY